MAKPIPQDETPVSRRERQNREIQDSVEVTKSRKAMEALLSVNKKISKTLEKGERVSKKALDVASKKMSGEDTGKVAKVVRGVATAMKVIGDPEMALKSWRAKSASATRQFEKEQAKMKADHRKATEMLKKATEDGDKDAIAKLKAVLEAITEAQKKLVADREKATGYFSKNEGFDKFKKGILDSIGNVRTAFDEIAGERAKPTKAKPSYVKLDPTEVAKSEKKADERAKKSDKKAEEIAKKSDEKADSRAKKSDEKAEKRSKKLSDVTEKLAQRREKNQEKSEKAKEKKTEAIAKAKSRKQIDAQAEEVKADQEAEKKTEAREAKRIKRDVAKSDLAKLANRLEKSFESRFGGSEDSGFDLDGDDKKKKKKGRKGKGKGKGRGKVSKAKPKMPKPSKVPKASGGALSRGARAVANVGSKIGGTVVRGALTAGRVVASAATGTAGAVVGSAVVGMTAGTALVESGLLGENLASQYTIGDLFSNWFGEGTRNLERALETEKKKALDKADKDFKDFKGIAWNGVPPDRLKEMKSPSMMAFVNRYYQLFMQETEWGATHTILSQHRDADKIPQDQKDQAQAMWKQAMTARIKYKKEYIEKIPRLGESKVDVTKPVQETAKATNEQNAEVDRKAKQNQDAIAQSTANAIPTPSKSPVPKVGTGAGTGSTGSYQAPPMGAQSRTGAGSGAYGGTGSTTGKQVRGASNASAPSESLDELEKFLMGSFIPALANAIADKIGKSGGGSSSSQSRQQPQVGKQSNPMKPSIPKMYK
jgi:hypothetical protein